jgi:hypothetical protein
MLRFFAVITFLLFALNANAADRVLFQVVSLDCQYCAALSESGGVERISTLAETAGMKYRVGVWGPVKGGEVRPFPHGTVVMFYAAAKSSPESSVSLVDMLYRYHAMGGDSQGVEAREVLIEMIADTAGMTPDALVTSFREDVIEHFQAWSKTAVIIREGLRFKGGGDLNTPSFIMLEDGQVVDFVEWNENADNTEQLVRKMINRRSQ